LFGLVASITTRWKLRAADADPTLLSALAWLAEKHTNIKDTAIMNVGRARHIPILDSIANASER
jgi:hypothetical protein